MIQAYFQHIEQLQLRTHHLVTQHGFDQLLIGSGSLHRHFLDDTRYAFRPNPHFMLWIPFLAEHPDCWLLIREHQTPVLFYHAPTDFWHKTPELPSDEWTKAFDIQAYDDFAAIESALSTLSTAMINEQMPELKSASVSQNPQGLIKALDFHRAIKNEWEQHCLREANYLAVKGHAAAETAFKAGKSEYEIHQHYLNAIAHNERDMPYDNIVGLNEHAAVLHYQFQQRSVPDQHRTLLIDAGARFNGYAADITRTFTPEGSLFADLVRGLDDLQLQLCNQISAGSNFIALHEQMHLMIADLLNRFGIITANPEIQMEQGITRTFYPHGLGHLLGLQVHDVGGWQQDESGTLLNPPEEHPFLRLTRTLEAGYVITVEPGVYFIPQLLQELKNSPASEHVNWVLVEQLLPYGGIRIEDNICVQKDGSENYTRNGFARL
ncbi:Xaa-Pro dipeptidase [Oceanospirillum sediminis]|uniref:Xaa-Pro dipeptidase n=1 Tax=Oceanospirillum sediminis TaxID=2760088 RepID=A0A839IU28_9GAMM|nr:Xaa-Pro dipeptidase [Oceanospirillum sediminis]MBB1488172.1 Xaa-Pro dipeptidase [Oceanospirillum sediminis]